MVIQETLSLTGFSLIPPLYRERRGWTPLSVPRGDNLSPLLMSAEWTFCKHLQKVVKPKDTNFGVSAEART